MALDHSRRCHVWAPLPGPNSSLMALLDNLPAAQPIMQTLQQAYIAPAYRSQPASQTNRTRASGTLA